NCPLRGKGRAAPVAAPRGPCPAGNMHGRWPANKRADRPHDKRQSAPLQERESRGAIVDRVWPQAYLSWACRSTGRALPSHVALMFSSLIELFKRMLNIASLAKRFFGSANERYIKGLQKTVQQINALEPAVAALPDDELRARTDWLKERLAKGESLDDV